jgi:hypothetical protein
MINFLLAQLYPTNGGNSPYPTNGGNSPYPVGGPGSATQGTESSAMTQAGVEIGAQIREATHDSFRTVLDSELFDAIAHFALFIGIAFLGWLGITWLRALLHNGGINPAGFDGVIHAVLIIIFLGDPTGNGNLLKTTVLGLNDIFYGGGQYIMRAASTAVSPGGSVYQEAVTKSQVQTSIGETGQKCIVLSETKTRQKCFKEAYDRATAQLKPYEDKNWAIALQQQVNEQLYNPSVDDSPGPDELQKLGDAAKKVGDAAANTLSKAPQLVLTNVLGYSAQGLLYISALTFGLLIESLKAIMALLIPFSWNLSLAPPLKDSWFNWLLGFFRLWLISFVLNLLIAINSIYMLSSNVDGMAMPLMTFIVSLGCAVGAFFSFWSSAMGIQKNVASIVISR